MVYDPNKIIVPPPHRTPLPPICPYTTGPNLQFTAFTITDLPNGTTICTVTLQDVPDGTLISHIYGCQWIANINTPGPLSYLLLNLIFGPYPQPGWFVEIPAIAGNIYGWVKDYGADPLGVYTANDPCVSPYQIEIQPG